MHRSYHYPGLCLARQAVKVNRPGRASHPRLELCMGLISCARWEDAACCGYGPHASISVRSVQKRVYKGKRDVA